MTLEELRTWVSENISSETLTRGIDEAIRERDVLRKRIDDAPIFMARRYASGATRVVAVLNDTYANKRVRLVVENENG